LFAEILCFVLLVFIISQQYWFSRELKTLLNLLSAKDWGEFNKGVSNKPPPKSRGTIDFEKGRGEGGD